MSVPVEPTGLKRYVSPLITCVLACALYAVGGLEFVERRWMDTRFKLLTRPAASDIVVVDIDSRSLRALEVWPWPRGYHATVLERLFAAKAKRVGLDVEFSSRSITEEDEDFERTLAEFRGRVVMPVFQQWQPTATGGLQLTTVEPLPAFQQHAILGSINVRPGPDSLVRRYLNRGDFADRVVPGFASAMAGEPRPELDNFFIDFGVDPRTIPRVSYVDVLRGTFDPRVFAGKAVIVGSTAVELGDQLAVPISAALPGPLVQALAYESLTEDRVMQRCSLAFVFGVALLLALLLGPYIQSTSWRLGLALTLGVSFLAAIASVVVQWLGPHLLDTSPSMLTAVGTYGLGLVRRLDQQAQRILFQHGRIESTESLMRHVVENSFDAIVTLRADGTLETFNTAAQAMFGYRHPESVGLHIGENVLTYSGRGNRGLPGGSLPESQAPYEAVGRRLDGSTFPLELSVSSIDSEGERKGVAFMRDITERKAQREALRHQANHDALTDLPNRYLLHERMQHVLATARKEDTSVAFLLFDLDRFKEINDALGHHTGDLLLKQIADRLRKPMRAGDTIARLGGDEFAVLLPGSHLESALRVAQTLARSLEEPFQVEGFWLEVGASVGLALFPEHASDVEMLIQRADVAMYIAKRGRTGLALYDPEQDHTSVRQLTLTGALRRAIRDGGLELHYQPKIAAATGRVIGVEALVRWNDPELGVIRPDELIDHAEHTGLIQPLTRWVVKTALLQSAYWHGRGLPLVCSVNISSRNLLEKDFPRALKSLLEDSGVPPERFVLEITESVIMEDPKKALAVISEFKEFGVGISIDDFGTGYSSLGYLKKLPATELKIDKSFVMEMDRDHQDAAIVRSTIELAHNLGLKVVAEGVETEQVWEQLKSLGCDIGQGYLFSRPLPSDEFGRWLQSAGTQAEAEADSLLSAG